MTIILLAIIIHNIISSKQLAVVYRWFKDHAMMLKMVSAGGVGGVRGGSPFEIDVSFQSNLTLQQWFLLIYWRSCEYPVTDAGKVAEVDEGTAIDVNRWLREICSSKLLQTPVILGGPGIVVQINESLFRHKPKVAI